MCSLHTGCAHGSFNIGNSTGMRESIDVRIIVMHADIEYPQAGKWAF
jgi:hypothetical protein